MIHGNGADVDTYRYCILSPYKLIVYVDDGTISNATLEKSKELIKEDGAFNTDLVMLLDFTKGTIKMKPAEMNQHIEFIETHPQWSKIRKFAIVTATPDQVAKAMLYKRKAQESGGKYEAFSTIEAAIEWLKIPLRMRTKAIDEVKKYLNDNQ